MHFKSFCFHHRNIHHVALEMYKVNHDLSPPFIKDVFCEINRKTRSGTTFSHPNVSYVKRGDRSLRSFVPIGCEMSSGSEGLDLFKKSMKSWKPENCPCELCKDYGKGLVYAV